MSKYASRKFLVTILVLALTTTLAYLGVMDAHVSLIFAAAITSYNVVNGWVSNGQGKDD